MLALRPASQSKVGDFDDTLSSHQYILGFDVAMDDACISYGSKCCGDLAQKSDGFECIRQALPTHMLPQVHSIDVFLGDVVDALAFADRLDLDQVFVVQSGGSGRFLLKTLEIGGIAHPVRAHDLDRNLAFQ